VATTKPTRTGSTRNAVITGVGIVSPIGIGREEFWPAALAGRSGTRAPTLFDSEGLPAGCQIVGEVRDFRPDRWMPTAVARRTARFSQLAMAAAQLAIKDSGLELNAVSPERLFVGMGTAAAGFDMYERNIQSFYRDRTIEPWMVLESPGHSPASHVAILTGAQGQTLSFGSACASGLDAVAWGAEQVGRSDADAVIAGGTESVLTRQMVAAFHAVGVLSQWTDDPTRASRPFDRLRSGMVLAEGAAVVVLEQERHARARGAKIYARVLGSGSAGEGEHLRKMDTTGSGVARAVSAALADAGLRPIDIDYCVAHGNSMQDYDIAETAGLKNALGRQAYCIPVSSLKSMCGQALGASGAMQVVAGCLAIQDQRVLPTINYDVPDPACDLDYVPNRSRTALVRQALVHAASMGGSHSVLVLGRPQ
jgi:3-oxoacyl-[acyl-carrier-protein] synthase II